MIERKRVCKHCSKEFTTSQYAAKYCSTTCRTDSRSSKKVQSRLEKLPRSLFFKWIASECRRAGTIEILKDVDLEALQALHTSKEKTYGYDAEAKKSKYHLCHISPVAGFGTIGLLHHANLFIGGSLQNQKHGNKEYKGKGLCIKTSSLQSKWYVDNTTTSPQLYKKIQQYLGKKLTAFLRTNAVKEASRYPLIRRILKHPDNTATRDTLNTMSSSELRELDSSLSGKEQYSLSLLTKRSLVVYHSELERFASYGPSNKDDYLFVADAVRVVAQMVAQYESEDFHGSTGLEAICAPRHRMFSEFSPLALRENKDLGSLRDFIAFTAFQTLQGASVGRELITGTLRSYLKVVTLSPVEHEKPAAFDFSWILEEQAQFLANIPLVVASISAVGLPLEKVSPLQSFNEDLACREYWKWDERFIQVEPSDHYLQALPF
ncbi:hypothetical protein [Pseudomonas sp.]|uniref:hypothetical protein n=1 Tax=Pseudomonas sp. TaxID=306 RepID=UPI003C733643